MSSHMIIISELAVLVFGSIVCFWVMNVANERRETIISGVCRDVPLSMKHRRIILSNDWAGFKFFPVGLLLVIGFAFLRVGQSSSDSDVQVISSFCALLNAGGALFVAVLGLSDLFFILSVLREIERD